MMINCTTAIPSNPSMYAGDVSVAILIILLILLTMYKVCGVWQNILNFKQVLNITIATTYLYVKVLHLLVRLVNIQDTLKEKMILCLDPAR